MHFQNYLLLTLLVIFMIKTGQSEITNKKMVFDTNTNEKQRISILVGKAGEDGDPTTDQPGDGSSEGELPVKSTSFESCNNGRCCYQFTWQGYIEEEQIPAPENATCEVIMKDKKDDSMACFDPIVYTSKVEGSKNVGNPPNITVLTKLAIENNWNIYCPLTNDKTCLTYKIYSRGGGKQIVNETRFCGSITETITGSRISSGCYSQKVSGYVREVCACNDRSFCNSAQTLSLTPVVHIFCVILYFYLVLRNSFRN